MATWAPSNSYQTGNVITPSNSATFPVTRAVYVGSGGSIVCTMNGQTTTFTGALAGTIYPIQITAVATASTAGSLLALY